MVRVVSGDLFTSGADVLVNAVNCVGVSGAGLAKEFASRFPITTLWYEDDCRQGYYRPGVVKVYSQKHVHLAYVATKNHWKDPSQLEWIAAGLLNLRMAVSNLPGKPTTIALPALGCGLGGLRFSDVVAAVRREFMYDPFGVQLFRPL